MLRISRVAVLGAGFALAAAALGAQQPSQPTFRSSIQLVRVDTVVVDADGNPVRGLTADDFDLFDRGKRQAIATFKAIHHEPPTTVPLGHRDVASNLNDDNSQLMVLVLDDLHIRKEWTDRSRQVAKDFVLNLGDDVTIGLLSTSGKFNVELTTDRARILEMLDRFGGGEKPLAYIAPGGRPPVIERPPGLTTEEAQRLHVNFPPLQQPKDMDWAPFLSGGMGVLIGVPKDSFQFFKLLESAARMLMREDRQHKGFAWISTGLAFGVDGLPFAVDAMRQAGVATYAIDPTGTDRVIAGGAYQGPGGARDPTPWDVSANDRHNSLTRTSRETGGIAVVGENDLKAGVQRIIQDFGEYYELGFYPDEVTTPGPRPLHVDVKRAGLTVRSRMTYVVTAPSTTPVDPIGGSVRGLMPKSDIALRLYAMALPSAGRDARVVIALEVTAPTAALASPAGPLGDTLKYGVFAVDMRKGGVAQSTTSSSKFTFGPARGAMPEQLAYTVQTSLTLPPGHYQLRASASSERMAKDGSVYLLIDVPDFRTAPLVMSDIVLGDSRVAVAHGANYEAVQATRALPFAPTLDREFTRAGTLRVYAEVAAKDARRPLAATVSFVTADGLEAWSARRSLTAADLGHISVDVPLASIPAGQYLLRVSATDGTNAAQREIGVVVK
jgi:VWFA-related protein